VHKDFAAGLQEMLETIAWHVIGYWQRQTGHRRLALAGGVGQNCTLNGQLLRRRVFDDVFVHPAAHDAGAALGAALKVQADIGGPLPRQRLREVFWGPALPAHDTVRRLLDRWRGFITVRRSTQIERDTAALLARNKVIGWVQGRSEFGPRALGNRSILADPRPKSNRDRVNLMVKQRETYRPFAPSVRAEDLREYFEFPMNMEPPDFMVFTMPVRPDRQDQLGAVTHVDGTARVHAVDASVNPRFWRLLTEFQALTGIPVLLNTSFNNHAEPIVDTVEDAVRCYLTTQIDHLVVGDLIVTKLPWTLHDLAELRLALSPVTLLRTEASPSGAIRHSVLFNYLGGSQQDIDEDLHSVLTKADGNRSLRELDVTDESMLAKIGQLWSERYIDLTAVP
jgi:predicted NodU family carbamoyl transferase